MSAAHEDDLANREAYLGAWMEQTRESFQVLEGILADMLPRFVSDSDIHFGLRALTTICSRVSERLAPEMTKFRSNAGDEHEHAAARLRDALFTSPCTRPKMAIAALRSLGAYVAYMEGCLLALEPASQAKWDASFVDAVHFATSQVGRIHAWVNHQIKTRSPQALVVPMHSS